MRRAIVAVAALGVMAGVWPALADPVLPAGDQVLADGTFTITEPVVMAPGSKLTIRNATVWLDFPTICPTRGSAGYCQPQIMLNGATLEVVDSTIDTHLFEAGTTDSMYAIVALGGRYDIRRSIFRHMRIMGAQGGVAAGPSRVVDSTFVDGFQGLSFSRGAEVQVERNRFEQLTYGLAVHDGGGVVRGNTFSRIGGDGTFGRAIDVQSTLVGDKAFVTTPTVEGNLVEDSHQALLVLGGQAVAVRDNTFRRNALGTTIGVAVGEDMQHAAPPVYQRNRLEANATAITVYTSGTPRTGPVTVGVDVRGTALVGTTCTDIDVLPTAAGVTVSVDARDSWWGTEDGPADRGPDCPAVRGNVPTSPWLTAPA